MKDDPKTEAQAADLRRRAEQRLKGKHTNGPQPLAEADTQRLVHELQVHQIELEMQNEELRQARADVEAGLERYRDFYDFAPVGYFTLDRQGTIRQVNLTGARLLGTDRSALVNRRLGLSVSEDSRPAFSVFLDSVFASQGKETCEIAICKEGPGLLWAHIEAIVAENGQECFAAVVDITETKRREQRLVEARRYSDGLVRAMLDGLSVLDTKGVHIDVNDAFCRMTGFSRDDLIGVGPPHPYWPPEAIAEIEGAFRDTLADQGRQFELVFLRKTGERFPVIVAPSSIKDEQGHVVSYFATVKDITDRKRAEDSLRESKDSVRAILDSVASHIVVLDRNGVIVAVNEPWRRFALENPDESGQPARRTEVGVNYLDVCRESVGLSSEDAMAAHDGIRAVLDGRLPSFTLEYACHSPTHERWFTMTATPLGTPGKGAVISHVDITERKRAEESLTASETKYRRLHESMRDAFVKVDMSGRIQESNRAYQQMLGYEPDELSALTYMDLTPNKWHAVEAEIVQEQILLRGYSDIYEKEYRRKGGTVFAVELRSILLRDDTGKPSGIWAIVRDITERKHGEEQLRAANVRLEQAVARAEELAVRAEAANRAKSEFLANMSHEIRTPMSAITGFAELLMSGECSASERREHLSTIQRNAESLLTIINDILDLSKIEAERLHLEQMDWPPRQVVEDVETLLRGRANEKHVSLEVTYVDPLPSAIRTDPARLRQILVNLVGNAIKFTDSGGVHLTVRWIPASGARTQMQFEVADSGIGISAEGIQGLFEPFSQVDMSSTRRFGGTGLGLSISQRLAEMLGGRIEVRSELGKGSTFTLTIDAGLAEKVAMPQSSSAPRKAEDRPLAEVYGSLHGRVLLVEDVPEMTQLMRCTLARTSLELDLAENGVVACEKAMASKTAGGPYDLILMDIRMPVMNGYEATRRLRAEGWVGPIVALTAHSMRGDREQCLEAGCDDYLSKPVSQAAFFGVLERYLGTKRQSADERPGPANPGPLPAEGKLFDGLLDDATVDQLLEEYAATLLVKAESLAGALTAHDLDLLAGLAHELKGVAGMYGFAQVSEKARFLQQLAAKANDLTEVEAQASELIAFCRRAAEAGGKNSRRPHEQVSDSSPPASSPSPLETGGASSRSATENVPPNRIVEEKRTET